MRKEFLEIGKIVGTHGVRGMVRIEPWADEGSFLTSFKKFYVNDCILEAVAVKPHGRMVIAAFKGYDTVEKAETLRGKILRIKREDANIAPDRYFIDELIGCKVFDADTDNVLGIVSDVSKTGANDVWHIKSGEKEYLIPVISGVVETVDIDSETVYIKPLGGIFDAD